MMSDQRGIGSPQERELQYYRRECNDLGARLLRLQEEQSQALLEARRSRIVVRLVREAYRLAEPSQATEDIGGALLQVVVENALCDRAALLREEPPGSGRFLMAHAIGVSSADLDTVLLIPEPPGFVFTSSLRLDRPPAGLLDVLRLPFVLWAYDASSGHALVIGNRSEANVSRPFESGDQELIEAALFVYLDVLYRKQSEAQLRQAKQGAEEVSLAQARFLEALADQLRPPVEHIVTLLQGMMISASGPNQAEHVEALIPQLAESSRELQALVGDALRFATVEEQCFVSDVGWIDVADIVRRVFRSTYPISIKGGVELVVSLPRRRMAICVDRDSMHRAIEGLVIGSLSRALPGSTVQLSAGRRGDGGVEILVSCPLELAFPHAEAAAVLQDDGHVTRPLPKPSTDGVAAARRIVEAHDGVLLTESRLNGGSLARIIMPADKARDDTGDVGCPPRHE